MAILHQRFTATHTEMVFVSEYIAALYTVVIHRLSC